MRAFRWLTLVAGSVSLLASSGRGDQPPAGEKPDLIVSDLALRGDDLVLEVQNQGPGAGKAGAKVEAVVSGTVRVPVKDKFTGKEKLVSKRVSVTVAVPVPAKAMATESVRAPLAKFGTKKLADFSPLFSVQLDPKKKLVEGRRNNNTYHRQLDFGGLLTQSPRGDYKDATELPDLVITDITQEGDYLVIHYTNAGKGATGADFLISVKSGKRVEEGNPYYRFRVPAPAAATKSGGFSPSALGLKKGDEAEIEATIDWEARVREADEKNNAFKKTVTIK